MSLFSDNIKYMRSQLGLTQQKVADDLTITRARLLKYEDGTSQPPIELLKKISNYYHVSIDIMVSVDLRKVPMGDLLKLGDNRILLPISVDARGENMIEIIPHKAQAGYLNGYSDPEFIETLQHISLPFLRNGKFRAFPVEGDSMPPHKDGSFIVGRYVEKLGDVLDGKTYILLTRDNGIVYKRLNKNGKNLTLKSDNSVYKPYNVKASEVLEIWEYACSIATKEFLPDDIGVENMKDMLKEIRKDIMEIKSNI
ncbi:LexA family transcriptional regulator [uncultured Flavobacterium sp.]|uniref:LexA family transcriptional regulator n=1 Tax=uncultured Flavobacterium sp. TaxID=165435 RepID=UPI0025EE2252|nr:LexA family transcriptional regulator [uncultured Flavobacterium sp.]